MAGGNPKIGWSNPKTKACDKKRALLYELKELNEKYIELCQGGRYLPTATLEDRKKDEKKLVKSGQLIINFYNDVFVPYYSKHSGRFFAETKKMLESAVFSASKYIDEKNYFGLTTLLVSHDPEAGNQNELGVLIRKLSKKI